MSIHGYIIEIIEIYIIPPWSITHEIYKRFERSFETGRLSLETTKGFDKVQDKYIIFKLRQNEISRHSLKLVTNFLNNRKQMAVHNV